MTSELDRLIRVSLEDLAGEVFGKVWFGREREVVSLYAFGHLLRYCRPGRTLYHPAQIALDGAVPQISGPNHKALVCKDLVLWPEPGITCWNERQEPVQHPLAILEWKVNQTRVSQTDVDWLCEFSREREDFLGYAVCLDLEQRRFRLSCTRVRLGESQPGWLVVPGTFAHYSK